MRCYGHMGTYPPAARALSAAVLLSVLLSVLLALPGCAVPSPPASAADILTAMQAAASGLPAGRCYVRTADPDAREYLSDTLLSALLGPAARGLFDAPPADGADGVDDMVGADAAGSPAVPPVPDAAVFLSETTAPGELAVLVCSDTDSALSVAALYRQRLDILSAAFPGTESAVRIEGCTVLAAFCRDAEAVTEAGIR